MSLAKVKSSTVIGVNAHFVEVEVDVSSGLPSFTIVGLPDAAVQEAKERVRAAIRNTGFEFPIGRITVNLAPADIRKEGPAFDLPIAVGILVATGAIHLTGKMAEAVYMGELSLDGCLRPVNGVMPTALDMRSDKYPKLVVPRDNYCEAALVDDVEVFPCRNLHEVAALVNGHYLPERPVVDTASDEDSLVGEDFSDVKGQDAAKRAMEIAAAGGHNVLMIGPPGSGKTMLARRIPGILPQMNQSEALEVTRIYSVRGLLVGNSSLINRRSFRSPHHTISNVALIGGGSYPLPGEVSLAHNGVLFLDELPEFKRDVLEVLRQPLEEGTVTIGRVAGTISYPAQFMLVAAMNPCKCGYYGDHTRSCVCTPTQINQYLSRISGPLLDRIDMHIEMPRISQEQLMGRPDGESSLSIRERVQRARMLQQERYAGRKFHCNAKMDSRSVRKYCRTGKDGTELLSRAMKSLGLSARAYDRILKVARTIADLDGKDNLEATHIAEAVQYRTLDRRYWA
ncbi:MAG: YifB family Mg chelatase-like AAA ATPase [bacterium]|nr:YifB family Mg chelatase-like AAA ATPase [bacterium]